jgi:Leucine-rich repeat (LRR) protein
MTSVKEFRVNEYISLKLEGRKTFIYIGGYKFTQCARLVLQIPRFQINKFDQIDSIEDAAYVYKTLYENKVFEGNETVSITPEEEFWGHCSNVQVWVENGYDTRILHSNISFPMLAELREQGDPLANRIFKEEIVKRLNSGSPNGIAYLIEEGFVDCLTEEELSSIDWEKIFEAFMILCKRFDKIDYSLPYIFDEYVYEIKAFLELLSENYSGFTTFLDDALNTLNQSQLHFMSTILLLTPLKTLDSNPVILSSVAKKIIPTELAQKVIWFYKNSYQIVFEIDKNALISLGSIGIDIIFILMGKNMGLGFEFEFKAELSQMLSLFDISYLEHISSNIHNFLSNLSLEVLEERAKGFYKEDSFEISKRKEFVPQAYSHHVYCVLKTIPPQMALEFLLDLKLGVVETILSTDNHLKNLNGIKNLIPISLEEFVMQWLPENEVLVLDELTRITGRRFNLLNGLEVAQTPFILVDESRHVVKLCLGNVSISQLPIQIIEFTHLTFLVLSHTNITDIPKDIGNLLELRKLHLSGNNIKTLPDSLCNLLRLEHLAVGDNPLRSLPKCIGKLQSLKHLDFYQTKVKKLPASFFKLNLSLYLYMPEHMCGYTREKLYTVTRDLRTNRDPLSSLDWR